MFSKYRFSKRLLSIDNPSRTPGQFSIPVCGDLLSYKNISVFAPDTIDQVSFFNRVDGGIWQESQFYSNPEDQTSHVELNDRWSLNLYPSGPGMVEWYAIAFANGETDRYPLSGFKSFTAVSMFNPSLFVNEIMAINDSTISDESGEFDDWFEIYNPEDYPARLEGFYVSDKKDNLTKWQFPASDIEILASILLFGAMKIRSRALLIQILSFQAMANL